jgi:hypothetical protein
VPHELLFYSWYALDLAHTNLRAMSKTVGFWIGTRDTKTVSLSLGLRLANPQSSEWCCTVYALDRSAFISALGFQIETMRRKRLNNLLCIHPARFTSAFKQIPELPKRTYLMKFGLFEKRLKQ